MKKVVTFGGLIDLDAKFQKPSKIKFGVFLAFACLISFISFAQHKPNVVLIYADDLGYGDIGVNGAIGVKTPHIDSLAQGGINFTDAHSPAATCTPSRYALLTGQYAYRRNAAILQGNSPLIIDPDAETLPKMLQRAGYKTGVVGKWHLGLGDGNADWNKEISPGPREVGFDYSFLIPATGDRVPCVYLENQRVVGLEGDDPIEVSYSQPIAGVPNGFNDPHLLKQHADPQHLGVIINGISRIGYMKGGKNAEWVDEDFPFVLTKKAHNFIAKNKGNPFFLFFSLHDIHQPRIANVKFVESSTMGPRGDVIAQLDWCVGQIVKQLRKLNIRDETLIIFTSDNGPVLDDGYLDYARELVGDHKPGGPYRGGKYSAFEAGTRVPTIVNWPSKVDPSTSGALMTQTDLLASLSALVGEPLTNPSLDSQDLLDAWLGRDAIGREYLLEEAYVMGLRWKNWKYIQPTDHQNPRWITEKFIDAAYRPTPQLYNLNEDPGELNNLASEYPGIVTKLSQALEKILKRK